MELTLSLDHQKGFLARLPDIKAPAVPQVKNLSLGVQLFGVATVIQQSANPAYNYQVRPPHPLSHSEFPPRSLADYHASRPFKHRLNTHATVMTMDDFGVGPRIRALLDKKLPPYPHLLSVESEHCLPRNCDWEMKTPLFEEYEKKKLQYMTNLTNLPGDRGVLECQGGWKESMDVPSPASQRSGTSTPQSQTTKLGPKSVMTWSDYRSKNAAKPGAAAASLKASDAKHPVKVTSKDGLPPRPGAQ
jgi:hypothetical protein